MKPVSKIIAIVAILGIMELARATVSVDCGVVAVETDITLPNTLTLDGIIFSYDNYGSSTDSASINNNGISGTTLGLLTFNFDAPAYSLNFDFFLRGGAPGLIPDALIVTLSNGGNGVADLTFQTTSFIPYDPRNPVKESLAFGSFAYGGAPFNQAEMYFSLDAPYFNVSRITYNPAPEPATVVLLACGMLVLNWRKVYPVKR
jgi:hypothetical protein